MKIQRIDENVVSFVLDKNELVERQIDVEGTSYGEEKLRRLFEELITKAQNEVGFKVHSPVLVEAIPLEDESMEFLIKCGRFDDELDSRFTSFTPYQGANIGKEIIDMVMGAFEKIDSNVKSKNINNIINASERLDLKKEEDLALTFEFDDVDKATDACKNVINYDYNSVFYKDDKRKKYYLVVSVKASCEKEILDGFNKACNTLAEYGKKLQGNNLTKAYFDEHYDIMIKEDAVKKLALL